MFHQRKNKSEKKIGYFVHILKCYNILICTKGTLKGFVTEDMLEVIDNSFNFVLYTNKKKKKIVFYWACSKYLFNLKNR